MEILTKKSSDNPNGVITLSYIIDKLTSKVNELVDLKIDLLYSKVVEQLKENKLSKGKLNKFFQDNIIDIGSFNITAANNIELQEVTDGTIYYDRKFSRLRIKTSKGWKTVKLED